VTGTFTDGRREHGELAAKPEIGETIPHGESGGCDPWRYYPLVAVHYTWQKLREAVPTRRGTERDARESQRRDDFPTCGPGGPAVNVSVTEARTTPLGDQGTRTDNAKL
jgi:hypothetical protein